MVDSAEITQQQRNHARQCSRRLLMQAIYQWQLNDSDYEMLLHQYAEDSQWNRCDVQYFCGILRGVVEQYESLADAITSCADRPFNQIDPLERSLLLLATYELTYFPQTPKKVVITEAIRLAKKFGARDSYRYVNAVLDKLAA